MANQSQDAFGEADFVAMMKIQGNGWTITQITAGAVIIERRTSPTTRQIIEAHMPAPMALAYLARAVAE